MKPEKAYFKSPIGYIEIEGTNKELVSLNFIEGKPKRTSPSSPFLKNIEKQLDEYFKGRRRDFDIRLTTEGTEFQNNVWRRLRKIPFGETQSYKDIASGINNTKAVRAVGGANNKNKIPIVIPCHRVIGKSGDLVGYAGGLWRKKWLLEHEKNFA